MQRVMCQSSRSSLCFAENIAGIHQGRESLTVATFSSDLKLLISYQPLQLSHCLRPRAVGTRARTRPGSRATLVQVPGYIGVHKEVRLRALTMVRVRGKAMSHYPEL